MFKNFSKILMFLLFFVFLTVSTVSAEDNVTGDIGLNEENSNYLEIQDIDNSVLGNSESNNTLKASLSTFKDLQNIIDNAYVGDTITLNKDYTYTTGDSPIFIGKSITIDGKNHIIDGKLATRILKIDGKHVTIKNIKFINAKNTDTDWGSAIDWYGDYANLQYCSFNNNQGTKLGGVVYLHGTNGKISHCYFNNNKANDYGGAVYWNGTNGELKNCSFNNNAALNGDEGGAVYWFGANGFLSGCSFNNNNYAWNGGAVYWRGANGKLSGCSFNNNTAKGSGGAVCWSGANGKLSGCSFNNNTAKGSGGAVSWYGHDGKLMDCSFNNNTAWKGGAVHWHSGNGFLSACSFVNNHAKWGGGGAVWWYGDNGFLSACSFVNNHADGYGGAVYWWGDNGKLSSCSFVNNHAKIFKGNVIYWFEPGDIFACTFSVFRPKNTNTVTVNNLIYYEKNNYNVNYYENGNKILNSGINKNITFFNLNSGKHTIKMIYKKDGNDLTNDLIIIGDSYLNSNNVYMFYNDGTKYKVKLTDYQGKPLIYKNLQITIKNKKYNLKTDKYGYATILLKQEPGQYSIIAKFNGDKDYGPSTFKSMVKILKSPITKNKNLKIYFMGGTFKVQIIHANGKNVGAGKTVKFTIAGKTYSKKTDKNGYASLKITQKPKTHTITTKYGKFITKNKITIQPVLTAKNIIKKKTKTTKFQAKLVNTKGKPQAKKKITFKFKGKTYKKLTNKKGIATLKIKNLKKGKYNIYTQYTKSKIKNTITIK